MFQEMWCQIETATDKKLPRAIADVADQYDDLMLGYSTIPDEAVEFLAKVFSCERILHARGIEHFLLEINVDLCKYTEEHRAKLLKTLVENAGVVKDELGRHSIGDFIARAFPSELAFATLLALSAGTFLEKHVAFVGLDVLRMREPKESFLYRKIESKWSQMLDSNAPGKKSRRSV